MPDASLGSALSPPSTKRKPAPAVVVIGVDRHGAGGDNGYSLGSPALQTRSIRELRPGGVPGTSGVGILGSSSRRKFLKLAHMGDAPSPLHS